MTLTAPNATHREFAMPPPQSVYTTVIATDGDLSVVAHCDQIVWPDGGAIGVHPVLIGGTRHLYLRALRDGHQWLVFDLRALARSLDPRLRDTPMREHAAVIAERVTEIWPRVDDALRHVRCRAAPNLRPCGAEAAAVREKLAA